jgi:hypothetical protein
MSRPSVIALVSLVVVLVAVAIPRPAAAEGLQDGLTVIAVDSGAAPAAADLDAVETALLVIAPQIKTGAAGYMTYGALAGDFRLLRPGAETMIVIGESMRKLRSDIGPYASDQFGMLSAVYAQMTKLNAPRGSRLIAITPGRIEGQTEATRSRLQSVGELYAREGWQIEVMSLPSTTAAQRDLMAALAVAAGGRYYDLGATEGLSVLLRDWMGLKLATAIDAELGTGVPSIASIDVAPRTASLSVAFLRSSDSTAVELFRPNGAQVDLNVPGNTRIETPNVVVYSIESPSAGAWRLQGRGAGAKLVAGADIRNPLRVDLVQEPPFAVGRETVLKAAAMVDGQPQALPGASITARVRWADGTAAVYDMNDAGAGADEKVEDGIFSVMLPAPLKQGFNDVALELRWADLGAVLRGAAVFRTEVFPAVQITRVSEVRAHKGDEAPVARVRVTVGQYPHLVSPSEVKAQLVNAETTVNASVTPVKVIENGKAWEFEVRAAPPASGDYTLHVALVSEHLGRQFTVAAPGVRTVATIEARPLKPLGVAVWVWAAIFVMVVAAAMLISYILRQVRPYGYLYDDQDRVVADFTKVSRSPVRNLLTRARVLAAEVPGLPFHGGEFEFKKNGVELHYHRVPGDPSIRVNGHPAGEVVKLEEQNWLGVGGRLLRFVTQRRPAVAPATGDGD